MLVGSVPEHCDLLQNQGRYSDSEGIFRLRRELEPDSCFVLISPLLGSGNYLECGGSTNPPF